MAAEFHRTVMKREVVECLDVARGGLFVDGTLGGGGHSLAILEAAESLHAEVELLGIDLDPEALEHAKQRLAPFEGRVTLCRANYAELPELLARRGQRAAGLVVDAGVSSHQLDSADRGFSFMKEGPLDMRMGSDGPTAAELLETLDEQQLTDILRRFGEVRGAKRLARDILSALSAGTLRTTLDLVELCPPRRWGQRIHPATQVFQALRIAVNRELRSLERLMEELPEILAPAGRCAFISFHSLEDRIVKRGIKAQVRRCVCPPGLVECVCHRLPTMKVLGKFRRPTEAEIADNQRSRSAKLRCACRV